MFFSGDPSNRKRVDLGGRSSKERDRQKLLEQTRLERNRRLWLRQQNSAAVKIQKCFRGRKVVNAERSKVREKFFMTYGQYCQDVNRQCFGPDSNYLRQLLFFFNPNYVADFSALVETCRLLCEFVGNRAEEVVSLCAGTDYSLKRGLVEYRVKNLTFACIWAMYENRNQLVWALEKSDSLANVLLEAVILLTDRRLPWSCNLIRYLVQRNIYSFLREIIMVGKKKIQGSNGIISSLEHVLAICISHGGLESCTCPSIDPRQSFSSQILTIPFLWQLFPHLKEIFAAPGLSENYVHQMALCVRDHNNVLPADISTDSPSYACLLENLLEAAEFTVTQPGSFTWALYFASVATFLLQELPLVQISNQGGKDSAMAQLEMPVDDELVEIVLNKELRQNIFSAVGPRFLLQLTNVLLGWISPSSGSYNGRPDDKEVAAIGAACAFLLATFNILPLEKYMTVLAYRTELVPIIWNFMKRCHENEMWSSLSQQPANLPLDKPVWLLSLAVFCPVYKYMLTIVDNEEFYEQQKPLSLMDIRFLIVILKQDLWHILWQNSKEMSNILKSADGTYALKRHSVDALQHRVSVVVSELLSQLQDWNNRREFTSPRDFNADGANESIMSQAMTENTKAYDILKQAPFLVPFTSRAKIFNSQLAAMKERNNAHAIFTRNRFKIRRNHILEDAFSQLNALAEEDLRGLIRITFVNEFGVEEAGIDGGGIFKDFMENITQAAFDIQYGLFKVDLIVNSRTKIILYMPVRDMRDILKLLLLFDVPAVQLMGEFAELEFVFRKMTLIYDGSEETVDHLLYPNPGSGMVHDQHLQYFHFLGTVLAKAMFEGILVDIPFATFFLSKLKQKYNYLNDLPSLDPELYRHLIFLKAGFVQLVGNYRKSRGNTLLPDVLKHYQGDISELELYFVIVNDEYGKQTEEELLPGGKSLRVTNENVITFIHLVANHRLNFQIRQQSSHFLRGFQQLIQKDWIDMFNEHELQLLISGSMDSCDVDDLRVHANYTGGYHEDHYVIKMFWEVIQNLSLADQRKFLKFATGCSRGPFLGFKYLEPTFCIQRTSGNASEEALERLPTAATCMNLLKLPPYRSKQQMEQKLLYAISSDAGFDLS